MTDSVSSFSIQKKVAVLSALLFVVKIAAWFITNSDAILTDALESIVNVAAGFFGVYSLWVSAKPRDVDHPYGHGKIEFISAAIEGTLITVAGVFIILHAIKNFFAPHVIERLDLGIILVGITAVLNFAVGAYCEKKGQEASSAVLEATGRHLKTDTYTTTGIIAGLVVLHLTRIPWIDGAVAILFALLILFTGYRVIRSSIAGIMDEADTKLVAETVQTLNDDRRQNWIDIHNLRFIKFGPVLHLDAHVTVPWYFNVNEAHHEADEIVLLLRENYGDSLELFLHTDGCMPFSCPICIKTDCAVRQHEFERRVEWTVSNVTTNAKHSLQTSG